MESCWIHREDKPREATRMVSVDGPNGFHREVGACYRHATDLQAGLQTGNYERLKQDANPARVAQITAAAQRQDTNITVGPIRRTQSQDQGMGISSPAPPLPPPPQRRPPPTYSPGYDGGRLVERCRALFARDGRLKSLFKLTSLDGASRERIVSYAQAGNPTLQVFGVVVIGDPLVVVLRCIQGPPPRIVELSVALLGKAGVGRGDCLAMSLEFGIWVVTALGQV